MTMSFGFFGIQIGFGLQNANVSRIFETLGARVEDPLLWIAAPVTGPLIQSIVGYLSDRTWNRLGRLPAHHIPTPWLIGHEMLHETPAASAGQVWCFGPGRGAAILHALDGSRERIGPGGLAGLQNRDGGASGGSGGFDSHTLPPLARWPTPTPELPGTCSRVP